MTSLGVNMVCPANVRSEITRGCDWWPYLPGVSGGSKLPNLFQMQDGSKYATIGSGVKLRDGFYCTGGESVAYPVRATDLVQFTVRVVFTPLSWPGAYTAITDQAPREFAIFVDTSGNISFAQTQDSQLSLGISTGVGGFTAGKRWDLVFAFAGLIVGVQNGTMTTYVNTKPVAANEVSGYNGGADFGLDWQLGANPSGGGSTPDIIYHELQVWPRVGLNAQQVQALHIEGQQRYPTLWNRVRPYSVFDVGGGGGGQSVPAKMFDYRRRRVA